MKSLIPTLSVANMETSLAFYNQVLGFETAFTMPGPDGRPVHASVRRGASEIMMGPLDRCGPEVRRDALGAGISFYFTVDDDEDIDAYFDRVKAAGATVFQEPTDQFWGHRDWGITDPDGYNLIVSKETRSIDWSTWTPDRELVGSAD